MTQQTSSDPGQSSKPANLEDALSTLALTLADELDGILKDPDERTAEMFRQARELLKDNGIKFTPEKLGSIKDTATQDPEEAPSVPPVRPTLVQPDPTKPGFYQTG